MFSSIKIKDILFSLILLICLSVTLWQIITRPKIAYVRTAVIIEKFTGMKEAKERLDEKIKLWQSNTDTLQKHFDTSLIEYKTAQKPWTEVNKNILLRQKQDLEHYKASIEDKISTEQDKMFQGASGQINSFIEKYGKEKGFTIILGTTASGNLLYADQSTDITEEILKGLNESYRN